MRPRSDGAGDQVCALDAFKITRHLTRGSTRPALTWHVAPLTPWAQVLMALHHERHGAQDTRGTAAVFAGRGTAHAYVRECEDCGVLWSISWAATRGAVTVAGP